MNASPSEILAAKREAQEHVLSRVLPAARAQMASHFKDAVRDAVREVLPEILEEFRTEGSSR